MTAPPKLVPPWVRVARHYEGLREVPGAATNPVIRRWLIRAGAWWTDDAAPWCGTGLFGIMDEAGITGPPAAYRAQSWATWGESLELPAFGCIAVKHRKGGAHVTLLVGEDQHGRWIGLGCNQRDRICELPYAPQDFFALRWPPDRPATERLPLPHVHWTGTAGIKES